MPIPKPNANEEKEHFISRCMGSEVMNSEFPKNEQRLAVCHQSWEDKGKKKDSKSEQEEESAKTKTN